MGNSSGKKKKYNPNELEWSRDNSHTTRVHEHFGKVYAVDVHKMHNYDDKLLVASASQDGKLLISILTIKTVTKNGIPRIKKAMAQKITAIPLRSAWVMSVAMAPSQKRIASGGLNNICTVYNIDPETIQGWDNRTPYRELHRHEAYVSSVKFISDRYLLSCSGDSAVLLWDVDAGSTVLQLPDAPGDVQCVDYIRIFGRDVIVYCCIDCGPNQAKIFIKDITDAFIDYKENENDNDDHKTMGTSHNSYLMSGEVPLYMIDTQAFGTRFKTDVNAVAFSPPNARFIGATSDDGSYIIYYRTEHYDHWWNINRVEWKFLCRRDFDTDFDAINGKHYAEVTGQSVTWADPYTFMVSQDKDSVIFVTKLIPISCDVGVRNAIQNGIYHMIESLPSMNWVGLTKDIYFLLMIYLDQFDTIDYVIDPKEDRTNEGLSTRTSSLASCTFGKHNQHNLVISGSWDKSVDCTISLNRNNHKPQFSI